jgi:hypothetical protein
VVRQGQDLVQAASAGDPEVGVDKSGNAVTSRKYDGQNERIEATARSAAGALSAVQDLSDPRGINGDLARQVVLLPPHVNLVSRAVSRALIPSSAARGEKPKSPALAGLSSCAREDSNLHPVKAGKGPQPCQVCVRIVRTFHMQGIFCGR